MDFCNPSRSNIFQHALCREAWASFCPWDLSPLCELRSASNDLRVTMSGFSRLESNKSIRPTRGIASNHWWIIVRKTWCQELTSKGSHSLWQSSWYAGGESTSCPWAWGACLCGAPIQRQATLQKLDGESSEMAQVLPLPLGSGFKEWTKFVFHTGRPPTEWKYHSLPRWASSMWPQALKKLAPCGLQNRALSAAYGTPFRNRVAQFSNRFHHILDNWPTCFLQGKQHGIPLLPSGPPQSYVFLNWRETVFSCHGKGLLCNGIEDTVPRRVFYVPSCDCNHFVWTQVNSSLSQ